MNYEQARQIGANGPAPGKWNWTNLNDSVQPAPFTVAPCAWPDFEWPPFDPTKGLDGGLRGVKPTGRERCDHDTQEAAERHHYEHDIETMQWREIDQKAARTLHRCDFSDCKGWAAFEAWQGGWPRGYWCWEHANADSYRTVYPFVPGAREIHS